MRRSILLAAGIAAGSLVAAPAHADDEDKARFAAVLPAAAPPPPANGAIFQADQGYAGLYAGNRAHRVGDLVTIVLVERTSASKSAGSKLDSDGGFGIDFPATGPLSLLDPGEARLGGDRGFDGAGRAGQSNALSGEITVTVAEVYPNGTMLVQGQKRMTLNRGDEFLRIRGIVRTADIDAHNRIASTRVADARIVYTGKGDVHRASRQGWLSRFFQVISPF